MTKTPRFGAHLPPLEPETRWPRLVNVGGPPPPTAAAAPNFEPDATSETVRMADAVANHGTSHVRPRPTG